MSEQDIRINAALAELRAINNGLADRCVELAAANAVLRDKVNNLEKAAEADKGAPDVQSTSTK